jgi:predicted permease
MFRRLWYLWRRDRLEDDLRAEMDWHVEQKTRQYLDEGFDPIGARRAALRDFGNRNLAREDSRAAWGFAPLDLFAQDVRYALRTFARQPLLVVIAVVSLGSAMAAGAAVVSLADAVLFAKLPVADPDRLVLLRWVSANQRLFESLNGWNMANETEASSTSFSYDAYTRVRERLTRRADVFAFADLYRVSFSDQGEPRVATGQVVSGNYYRALGIRPAAGRFITDEDDRLEAPEIAAVISHSFWQRRFGGRRDAVGRLVRVNGVPVSIVGVAPPGFNGTLQVGQTTDVTLPIALYDRIVREPLEADRPATARLPSREPANWWVIITARALGDADPRAIQPEVEGAVRASVAAYRPDALKKPFRVDLRSAAKGQFEQRAELVEPVAIMAGIVAVVVLIACANLASLLLARGAARDREIAVRLAIGASRRRIIRQLFIESAILGLSAGVAGVAAASWLGEGLLPALGFEPVESGIQIVINARVLAVGFAGAVLCTLMFGLVPAIRGSAVPPIRSIKEGSGTLAGRVPRLRLARIILTLQVALSVVVLVAAALLVHSIRNLQQLKPGFDPDGVLLFRVDPAQNGYGRDRIHQLTAEILDALRAAPGVESASLSQHGLLYGWSAISDVNMVDGVKVTDLMVNRLFVDEQFFKTFRVPFLAGRGFAGSERATAIRPVVINRTFAERTFKGVNAVGHRFAFSEQRDATLYEVVGVVSDLKYVDLRRDVTPTVFFFYRSEMLWGATFAVRTFGPPEEFADTARAIVATIDRDVAIDRVRTQKEELAYSLRDERLFATLASLLGLLALLLACIGVYGLMAYAVARRTPEIGIRMALGAERRRVLLMVIGDAARVMAIGLGAGLVAAYAASRYLESLLFGLQPTDPAAQAGAVALLTVASLAAALIPARRASRVDPQIALRSE